MHEVRRILTFAKPFFFIVRQLVSISPFIRHNLTLMESKKGPRRPFLSRMETRHAQGGVVSPTETFGTNGPINGLPCSVAVAAPSNAFFLPNAAVRVAATLAA